MRRTGHRGAPSIAAAALLAACAVTPSSQDPFAGAGGAGDRPSAGMRPYRVRLEVVCDRCAITYAVAARTTSAAADEAIWRASFVRYPRFPEAIRLTASGNVERIRIYVNGELAASRERETGDGRVVLQAETVIPLPAEGPVPDTLGLEGRRPSGR